MLGDVLLENGSAAEALREYEAALKSAPRRFRSLAGAAQSAGRAGDSTKARAYAAALVEMCRAAEGSRPELDWARAYLERKVAATIVRSPSQLVLENRSSACRLRS
jgi:hypothetical protein